jgi:DivIVA domain-containing protein
MIDLTPLDVRKKKGDFTRALRGYEPASVDDFLDVAADRLEELVRENGALKQRGAELTESLEAFRQRERAMNEALISAQQLREEVRTQAAREAELVLREARSEAERLVAEASREAAAIADSLQQARAGRARFLRSFRAFIERQMEEIEMEEERSREGGWSDGEAQPAAPQPPRGPVANKRR